MERPGKEQIRIKGEVTHKGWIMEFNLPAAIDNDIPQGQWRKIIRLILSHDHQDSTIVPALDEWFGYLLETAKAKYEAASLMFIKEYRALDFIADKKEKTKAKKHNDYLKREAARCKAQYDKYEKRKLMYEGFKQEFHVI